MPTYPGGSANTYPTAAAAAPVTPVVPDFKAPAVDSGTTEANTTTGTTTGPVDISFEE